MTQANMICSSSCSLPHQYQAIPNVAVKMPGRHILTVFSSASLLGIAMHRSGEKDNARASMHRHMNDMVSIRKMYIRRLREGEVTITTV